MSLSAPSKRKTTLSLQEIKCKNGCGFYGNPEWQGYCSKCHREINQKIKPDRSAKSSVKKPQRSNSDVHESATSLGFSKFEEKKKQQSDKRTKTIKSIIKRGHTLKESSNHSPSRDSFHLTEAFLLNRELQLKETVAKDVVKQMQRHLELMGKYYDKPIDEQSEVMQDFYNFMFNRCETHPAYQEMSSEQVDLLMDKIEEQLMSNIQKNISQQIASEYEEKDLALQKRIRSLNWITSQHLGLNITENSPDVRDFIDKAIADVIQMDSQVAPQQKIKCIVNCSASIFNIIRLCQGVTASADEFLPAMVYIVLKANPPLLQSNIKYITSYSIPTRLRSGEGAYYFTNLCCAVAFIEDLTAESLNMQDEEFQRYLSGEVPLSSQMAQNASACEGLRLMTQNLVSLNDIQEKNDRLLNEMNSLRDDMEKFHDTIQKCMPKTPLVINPTPYTVPANTDMSLIPELLRSRVVKAPTEDILVEIDYKPSDHPPPEENSNLPQSELVGQNDPMSCISSTNPTISTDPSGTLDLDNFLGLLPTLSCVGVAPPECTTVVQPVHTAIRQSAINIEDVDYPTDLISDMKHSDSTEFGEFESCDMPEANQSSADPLSPQTEFMEGGLNLPPPLQPVVVQNVNADEKL